MNRIPRLHAVALATGLLAAATAHAQQTAADPKLDVVVVTGIRASLESALNAKRQDRGIVDVVKAEDIAKFPDTNLAESLQRVPGVVIDRDAGEGRNITVRGLGADFTRVRINGIEALATTGGTDSSGGANRSRGFDFNVFASELFNSLTVRKSNSADVDEGSLGATVDLQAARPLDFKRYVATVSAKAKYNDLSGKTDPRVAFLLSNTFANNSLGFLVSGAYSRRQVFEEGFSTVRWDNVRSPRAAGASRRTRPSPAARRPSAALRNACPPRPRTWPPTTWRAATPTSTRACRATAASRTTRTASA
jgi:iron complex outermembrane receptor protein